MDAEISAQLLLFVEQTTEFVGVADGWGRIVYANPAAAKRLGIVDPAGHTLADVFPAEEWAFYHDVVRPELLRAGAWTGEVRVNIAGEDAVRMQVSATATIGAGGSIDGLVVHAREVPRATARGADAELEDATLFLEPAAFDARIRRALLDHRRGGKACGLVLVDVSGVNDPMVVRSLAGRLARFARSIDVAGRVDDGRLALLLGAVRTHGEAARIAHLVCASITELPVPTASGEVSAEVGCGAAVSAPGDEPVDLIERAVASIASRSPADVECAASSPSLDEFRIALSLREVRPYARPVVDLVSGRTVGYRGTARWHHRTLGVLDPPAFVDLITATPLASQLHLQVVRELAEVLALSTSDASLALYAPVSTRLIADVRTEQFLTEIADAFRLSLDQMRLQLDRPLLDAWSPSLQDALESLREAGVSFILTGVDDVADVGGFDEILLSGRLIRSVASDPEARRTVSEIVRVAQERAVVVGAAGVDTEVVRDVLLKVGCKLGSGDLYGPAVPARDID